MTMKLGLVLGVAMVMGCGAPAGSEGDDLGMCPTPGWCWLDPTPQGNGLRASWGTARDDVWMVGDNGTALHYDGAAWSFVPSATHADLTGVWGGAVDDVWAWGPSTLVHWDGKTWTTRTPPDGGTLLTVWHAPGAHALWASTTGGIFSGNGASWRAVVSPQPAAQFAGGVGTDVWAVGAPASSVGSPIAMHWDGVEWARVETAIPPDRVVVDGDGTAWFAGPSGNELQLERVTRDGGDALLGLHVDGHALGMLEFRPDGFFIATTAGKLVHAMMGDGRAISDLPAGVGNAFWGADAMDLWLGGARGGLAHYESMNANVTGSWTTVAEASASATPIFDVVAGHGKTDVWALSRAPNTVFHDDGQGWSPVAALPETGPNSVVTGIAAFRDHEMIATTSTAVLWFDGTTWSVVRRGVFGAIATTGNDVWVANLGAETVDHWNGDTWTPIAVPAGASIGIAATAPDDAWFAGVDGVFHYDGTGVTRIETGPDAPVAVGALSRGHAFVAFGAYVEPITGDTAGNPVLLGMTGTTMMSVRAANDVWFGAPDGSVSHFDGDTFTASWSGTRNLRALFPIPHAKRVIAYGALDADANPTAAVLAHD